VLAAMRQDSGIAMNELRVDGGACANNLLMQFQADLLQVPVVRPKVIETTALGAAFLAGLATGVWHDAEAIGAAWQPDRRFAPQSSPQARAELVARWQRAVSLA